MMRHLLGAAIAAVMGLVAVVDVGTSGAIVVGLAATVMVTGLVAPHTARDARDARRPQPAA